MSMQTSSEFYLKNAPSLYIETYSGAQFHINDPKFDLLDIAHALSQQCRYTGHTSHFYSVAEHSVLVASIVDKLQLGSPFEGLMHDAAEAYLSDIASPWKALLPDYKILEARIETPLRKHYGVPAQMSDGVKKADWLALFLEADQLIPSRAKDWIAPPGIKETFEEIRGKFAIHGYESDIAKWKFLDTFAQYKNAV